MERFRNRLARGVRHAAMVIAAALLLTPTIAAPSDELTARNGEWLAAWLAVGDAGTTLLDEHTRIVAALELCTLEATAHLSAGEGDDLCPGMLWIIGVPADPGPSKLLDTAVWSLSESTTSPAAALP